MDIYKKRRDELANKLEDESLIILFSGKSLPNSEDENFPFSINRNFYYLTGLEQEDMVLFILNHNGKMTERLFIPVFDELIAKWVGGRISLSEAKEISGIENIAYRDSFKDFVSFTFNRIIRNQNNFNLYMDLNHYHLDNIESEGLKFANEIRNKYPAVNLSDIFHHLTKLRMVKDEYEVKCHQDALEITNQGILAMMSYSKANIYEAELEKVFELELAKNNCRELAFPTIAAGGKNATILHYVANNKKLNDGDLFLCDLGATKNHYCADISRTFPVNGKFTARQKEIYQIVLNAQKIVEDNARIGITTKEKQEILN